MIGGAYVRAKFPELSKIKNEQMRRGVIKAWVLAIKGGGWRREERPQIDDIPFTLAIPTKMSLIEHTRRVTKLAILIGEMRGDLDIDILVAGALTHDVGKLLEFTCKGNKIVKSELGKRVRHPVSGYELVLRAGLPYEVAHIVATHSTEGDVVERSPEAIVVHHCDFIEFDIAKTKK